MGSDTQPSLPQSDPNPVSNADAIAVPDPVVPEPPEKPYRGLRWIFVGAQGLRAGWSIIIFLLLFVLFTLAFQTALAKAHLAGKGVSFTARTAFFGEFSGFVAMLLAAGLVARIERRHILDYNLRGPSRMAHFFSGLGAGFAALSALVGALAWGGWLHFGPAALSGAQIAAYAAVWACVFLLVGCVEEGVMRCFLLYTFTRGINFWWAIGLVATMCVDLIVRTKGNGAWGVYIVALLGLVPCLLLHLNKAPGAGFWQAAWVTSTFFGMGHTGNNGENWIGIFAAAFIGFVFCVSVRVTGSAWWAIGCHAAWDWGETYFYGTADSGYVAPGHYLSTTLNGPALWSGGADGPEGSLMVVPVCLVLLALLLVVYGRRKTAALPVAAAEPLAG